MTVAIEKEKSEEKESKYLTFVLGNEEYGIEILKVREIIGYMSITSVPQTPKSMKGVINLRGQVIPVVDLRLKFDMEEAEVTDKTCIVVVEAVLDGSNTQVGMVVDAVSEVLDIDSSFMEEPPEFGADIERSLILAMAIIGDSVKILLDIDKVLFDGTYTQSHDEIDSAPMRDETA